MALLELVFGKKKRLRIGPGASSGDFVPIGVIEFDASISETHNKSVELTDHPVEEGADITDHIRQIPESVDITGIVSNTPISFLAVAQPEPTRAEDAYGRLKEMMDNGEEVSIITSLREYQNMILTTLGVSRDASTGNVVIASMSFREILKAKTQRVAAVDVPEPKQKFNRKSTDEGKVSKDTAPAKIEENTKSALLQLKELAKKLLSAGP